MYVFTDRFAKALKQIWISTVNLAQISSQIFTDLQRTSKLGFQQKGGSEVIWHIDVGQADQPGRVLVAVGEQVGSSLQHCAVQVRHHEFDATFWLLEGELNAHSKRFHFCKQVQHLLGFIGSCIKKLFFFKFQKHFIFSRIWLLDYVVL